MTRALGSCEKGLVPPDPHWMRGEGGLPLGPWLLVPHSNHRSPAGARDSAGRRRVRAGEAGHVSVAYILGRLEVGRSSADRFTSMGDERRSIERLTDQLRNDPGLSWGHLREFLTSRGVDPKRAAIAVLYPDDAFELTAVVVASSDRMFEIRIEYPRSVKPSAAMEHGEITEWEDDAAQVRRENQPFSDIALELLEAEIRGQGT